MRKAGLVGRGGRRRVSATSDRDERAPAAPDLVNRYFAPEAPGRLWAADITYAESWEGWLYLVLVLDAYTDSG